MSHYLIEDTILWPTTPTAFTLKNSLPVGTYTVGQHPMRGFYLKPMDDFKIEGKVYGDTTRRANRILTTFKQRPSGTGVLLNGEKGSGKTMLAKMISQKAAEQGIATLVINTPYCGDAFNKFIQEIDEPCVIVFDEFEKVYDAGEQQQLLTLLDGVFPSKKLFILTVNDRYGVNQHMRNRPGRIFYAIEYKGLTPEFIREYCQDTLDQKQHTEQIVRLSHMFDQFNFDMLKALVEEMNRYNETPVQALELLNAKPHEAGQQQHTVEIIWKGKKLDDNCVNPSTIRGNPIAMDEIDFWVDPDPQDDECDAFSLDLHPADLKKVEPETGRYTYVTKEGTPDQTVVVITRKMVDKGTYNWMDAF